VMQVYQAADKSAESGFPVDLPPAAIASDESQQRPDGSVKNVTADHT